MKHKMKEPKSFEQYQQMPARQQAKWVDEISQSIRHRFGGIVADPEIDIMIYFIRDPFGNVKIINVEKLSDVYKRHGLGILAERSMMNTN